MPAFADLSPALDSLRAAGISLFSQNARLLRLRFAEDAGIGPETLLPHRVHGEEGLSQNYRYTLDGLSPDAGLELKAFLGQPVEVGLLLPAGGERLYSGLVTRAEQRGSNGGLCLYTLTIEPALALLAHRRNSRVWQDKNVVEIITTILQEHHAANPAFARSFAFRDATRLRYPPRSYCLQYRETDLAFITRLLAEEGIAWRYVHGPSGDPASPASLSVREADTPLDDGVPLHTLVLFDDNYSLPFLTPEREIGRTGRFVPAAVRFHRTAGVEHDDALDVWHGSRQVQSGRTTLLSYDYQRVAAHVGTDEAATAQGRAGDPLSAGLEDYDPQTLYYGSAPDEMARYAALRQAARDRASKTFHGEGSVRRLMAGAWFPLADHPDHDRDREEDRQFLVTRLAFAARNNLLPEADDPFPLPPDSPLAGIEGTGKGTQSPTPYRARLETIRRHIRYVPDYTRSAHQKPTAPGGTTATVVGPDGEEIHTDEHGRIRLQFHWQRKEDHPDGGADRDERSSTWVRVAYPSAGAAWGTQYIPRIGQEVLVSFLENDIDRPVVTGVLYNGTHRPPDFSAAGRLPANKTLSGHKSKEYKGQGYNELLLDDTTNELRTKLSSEHGKTQLNQGYLIHPRTDGKGEPRGEGFELRTDRHGAIRAAQGVLISAEERGHAVGRQLDRDMLLGQMQTAEGIARSLSDLSDAHGAESTETSAQSQLVRHVENWEHGSNTARDANIADGGKPIVAISGPLGVAVGTPESVTVTAGHNIDVVSVKHANFSVGGKWLARIKKSMSVFVHELGMKLVAAGGDIDVEAHAGEIHLSAAKKIVLTSNTEIVLQAPKVTTIANGARADLGGGAITTRCSGTHEQKAGYHKLTGPGGAAPAGAFNPQGDAYDQQLALTWTGTEAPIQNRRYRLRFEDGRTVEGVTDDQGRTETLLSDLAFARYRVELLPEHNPDQN